MQPTDPHHTNPSWSGNNPWPASSPYLHGMQPGSQSPNSGAYPPPGYPAPGPYPQPGFPSTSPPSGYPPQGPQQGFPGAYPPDPQPAPTTGAYPPPPGFPGSYPPLGYPGAYPPPRKKRIFTHPVAICIYLLVLVCAGFFSKAILKAGRGSEVALSDKAVVSRDCPESVDETLQKEGFFLVKRNYSFGTALGSVTNACLFLHQDQTKHHYGVIVGYAHLQRDDLGQGISTTWDYNGYTVNETKATLDKSQALMEITVDKNHNTLVTMLSDFTRPEIQKNFALIAQQHHDDATYGVSIPTFDMDHYKETLREITRLELSSS